MLHTPVILKISREAVQALDQNRAVEVALDLKPALEPAQLDARLIRDLATDPAFADWVQQNVSAHKVPGYAIANISVKMPGRAPGDLSSDQMDALADLADTFSFGEMRVTHRQNIVFTDVKQDDLHALWQKLVELELATANLNLIGDVICCPGLDYCALANARSIPVAEALSKRFEDLKRQ